MIESLPQSLQRINSKTNASTSISTKRYPEISGFSFFTSDFASLFSALGFFGRSFFDEADNVRSIYSSSSFNSDLGDFSFGWENWFPLNFRLRSLEESRGIFIRENLTKAQLFSEIEQLKNTLVQTSETISDSAECYAGLSVRFESSAACKITYNYCLSRRSGLLWWFKVAPYSFNSIYTWKRMTN